MYLDSKILFNKMIYFLILFEIFYLLMNKSKISGQDLLSPIDFSLNDLWNTENNYFRDRTWSNSDMNDS